MKNNYHFETRQLHAGRVIDSGTGALASPIYQSAAYVFENCDDASKRFALQQPGNIYSRITNPTQDAFEKRICSLEGGALALAVASGSSAIAYSIQNIAGNGDHIVVAKNVYGGTYNLFANTLPTFGITSSFVDPFVLASIESSIQENTKAIFIESITNPHSNIVDIEAIAKIAHKHGVLLFVDNTFASPYLIRPIEYGADVVIHSATKFIGGHGTTIGGVIVDAGTFDFSKSTRYPSLVEPTPSYHGLSFSSAIGPGAFVVKIRATLLRDLGACLSPFNSFLLLQGLETLSLRVERHVENTKKVIDFLLTHPSVKSVNHPSVSKNQNQKNLYDKYLPNGGASIFTIDIDGTLEQTKKFIDNLELFSLVANVADVKSLVIHPGSSTHSQLTKDVLQDLEIYETTVRLSIGIENSEDIINDLQNALEKI